MNTEKDKKIYSKIFKLLYYIFCGLFGAAFLCFAALVIIVRLSDYHGKSFEEMLTLARYRISSADMASLVTDMTIGYIPNRESVEENSNEIIKKLNDNWDDVLYYYGNVKNTDFAVIVAGTDRLSELNLNDESLYLYKSPDYESYDSHLCGRVFGTIFYPSYYPAEVILDLQTGFYQRDTESDYLEDALYIHVLYSPVSNPVESDADHFDSLFTDKNILSLIDIFNTADTVGIPAMIVSFICGIICFVLITMTAGHTKNKEEITLSFFDRIPLEIAAFLLAGAEILLIACSIEILDPNPSQHQSLFQ